MNKKTALAALILSAGLMLTACTAENNPLSSLFENEQSTTDTSGSSETTTASDDPEITTITTADETTDGDLNAEGGNPEIADYIEVTVSEDKYFYQNHEISYDDLIRVFDGLDGNTAVRISDENATLKAYESLTKALEEREILYEAAS